MQPFKLPEFYMPFSARLNAHLDAAREHGKAWARQMGMLDFGVWDEPKLDSFDFALFAALIHPDAPSPELELVNDWYVWGFFLDDALVETFKRGRPLGAHDLAAAKEFLSRLPTFMPADSGVTPVPTNLIEWSLADLWSRTAPILSADWRRRFSNNMQKYFEGSLWELVNISQNRIPDPVDYVEMRRKAGGTDFSADLSELAVGLEIPPEISEAMPMRALAGTFADWVGLSNDIFSFQREIEQEGEINNSVLVIQRFLGCDLQRAVNVVNDLVTSRLRQFEHIVATALPALFEEVKLDSPSREKLLEYVKGLQNWLAGDLWWHRHSARYPVAGSRDSVVAGRLCNGPTGLGTSAARIGLLGGVE